MTTFTLDVSHNPFLARGAARVDVVVSITAAGAGSAVDAPLAEAILVDCSGSMAGPKMEAAKAGVVAAVELLPESAWFTVVAGADNGKLVLPVCQATAANKRAAAAAVKHLAAGGGPVPEGAVRFDANSCRRPSRRAVGRSSATPAGSAPTGSRTSCG